MLSAFAIENYLKGALVVFKKWSKTDIKQELPKPLKSHNLTQLAELVKLPLNEEEADLMERLSEYAIWAGRYPVPLFSDNLRPQNKGPNIGNQLTMYRGSDTAVINCLLERLADFLATGKSTPLTRLHRSFDGHTLQMNVRAS